MNLFDVISRHAATTPDHPALISGESTLSCAQLVDQALRWGAAVEHAGVRPGDRLGIALKDTPDFILAMLGAAGRGIVIVPLDWRAHASELNRLAEHFKIAAVLTEPGATAANVDRAMPVDAGWHATVTEMRPSDRHPPNGDSVFAIKLSSGTTGLPKGAVMTHRGMIDRLNRNLRIYGSITGHRYLSALPLCFSGGNNYCLFHLMSGNTVVLYPPLFAAREYVEAVARYDITFAFAVPTVLRWLLQVSEQSAPLLPTLRVLLAGTSSMSADEKRQVAERICPNFYETYGSSAIGHMAALKPEEIAEHADSVGRPNSALELEVVDDRDEPLPGGQTGAIRCRGPGVAQGYFGDPDQSGWSERVQDGWCYPGDLGFVDAAGYLHVVGRVDDLIIRGGVNIHPAAVEAEMMRYPALKEVAVVGRANAELGQEVVAFVVAGEGFDKNGLATHCRGELAPHMVPVEIIVVDSMPRTAAGKTQKRKLLEQL